MEEWPMYYPRCGDIGPESVHFFHQALSLDELCALLDERADHPALVGQLVHWQGQIVPVVQTGHGQLALQVDPACCHCGKHYDTYLAISGRDGSFSTLLGRSGSQFTLSDKEALLCADCIDRVSDSVAQLDDTTVLVL
jgi:hypothetical protein